MNTRSKIIVALSLLTVCTSCSDSGFKGFDIGPLIYLRATVFETCEPGINFSGDDIYGYLINDPDFGGYWQLGGHTANTTNEIPDLGLNIFVTDIETGTYEITDGFVEGKAFIYYFDADGNEYNSTLNNGSVSAVFSPGSFSRIEITFLNVEVYNATLDQTMCINNFTYSFAY